MERLTAELREQMKEGRRLDAAIGSNLEELGYGRLSPSIRLGVDDA